MVEEKGKSSILLWQNYEESGCGLFFRDLDTVLDPVFFLKVESVFLLKGRIRMKPNRIHIPGSTSREKN